MIPALLVAGCYSFTGASLPEHLRSIEIPTAEDNSSIGNALFREVLTQEVLRQFRNDNALVVVDESGDSRLTLSIASITDQTTAVQNGERETERRVTVSVKGVWYDAVKRRQLWDKSFQQFRVYEASQGITARDRAIEDALRAVSEDILLATVSGW
jgi:outer membrane lipopolysaccharide assembly protein LptE/RlpB